MRDKRAISEQALARIAVRQHGVVSRPQLLAAGIEKSAISRRVAAGRLHRVHRGVYAVGHPRLSHEGRLLAAALACGDRAVVSHRSAAALWGLLPPSPGPIDVTVPGTAGRRQRTGIRLRRAPSLADRDTTRRSNVPVTTPVRTIRDLRRSYQAHAQRAHRRALDLRLVSPTELEPDPDLTRSELERMFLRVCRRRRIPAPEVNSRVGRYEVDFLWRDARLIAETDGFRYHGHRGAFESDRARDAHLQALGYRVVRFTYRQVVDEPAEIADSLRALLRGRT